MAERKSSTISARAGVDCDLQYGAVIPPISLSSTYSFRGLGQPRQHDYSRSGNPTRDQLGQALGQLEGGCDAVITASGMGAIHTVLQLLGPEDCLVVPEDCYGGSFRLFHSLAERGAFRLRWTDFQDEARWIEAIRGAHWVWIETPSNPLLRITDVRRVCELARREGAKVVVDNTFLSPALQQPLALGADVVVHSTTKYINGHSDVVGGAVVAAEQALAERLAWWANCIGVTGSPFDAWLTLRGLRTLNARLVVQQDTCRRLVELLNTHPSVSRVYYPGLADHPGHLTARSQQSGFGAMVSFELVGGEQVVRDFVKALRHFTLAESLGGVESLIAHPCTMTHAAMPQTERLRAGLTDGLLRISVGLEDASDLADDLRQALDRVVSAGRARGASHVSF
jgi:cystathionine gamma-synthase